MQIENATTPEDFAEARELILEYANSLDFGLEFQKFDRELENLSEMYGVSNSALLLARVDGIAAGTVALRPFDQGRCEMKRMWVRPQFRQQGIGRSLAREIINIGRQLDYRSMLLDTTARMQAAIDLYSSFGFVEISPYRHNPIDDAKYYQLELIAVAENNS
ncbi:MAG: putative acetyltransferase [Pirellulaceae bacterium]|jgi:putative acetyltransferase